MALLRGDDVAKGAVATLGWSRGNGAGDGFFAMKCSALVMIWAGSIVAAIVAVVIGPVTRPVVIEPIPRSVVIEPIPGPVVVEPVTRPVVIGLVIEGAIVTAASGSDVIAVGGIRSIRRCSSGIWVQDVQVQNGSGAARSSDATWVVTGQGDWLE
jgi:hypothetical protein